MCHFINRHPSVLQDHVMDSFHVCISKGSGCASDFLLILNACANILEFIDQFADNLLLHDNVPILH